LIAIIMAGGRSTRFRKPTEKATLSVGGLKLLERSANALNVEGIDDVIVATGSHTPDTESLAMSLGIESVRTKGSGYHQDTIELLGMYGNFVSLNVDVPFVSGHHVRRLLAACRNESLSVVTPASEALVRPDRDSVMKDVEGADTIWVGLNFVTADPRTGFLVLDDPLLSVNINTETDLEFAEKLAMERGI